MSCSTCKAGYHPECVNKDFRSLPKSEIQSWTCPSCQSKVPKTDNTLTPVRQQAPPANGAADLHSSKTNVTLRPQNRELDKRSLPQSPTPEYEALAALTKEIKLLRDDMVEVKTHLKSLSLCVENCGVRLNEFDKKLASSDDKIRTLEDREIENALLHQKVSQLEDRLSSLDQNTVRNEIEIQGVNEHANENLFHTIKVTAMKIGVVLSEADIDDVSRVGPRRGADTQNSGLSLPRPVVLRFVRHMKREEFLKAAKARRNITTDDIEVEGRKNRLFFNDRLTKENRQLFRQARLLKSSRGYKYCWTSNGRIFIRKRDGGPVIAIRGAADLDRTRETDHASSLQTLVSQASSDPSIQSDSRPATDTSTCEMFRTDV